MVESNPADQNIRAVARLEQTARLNRSLAERVGDRIIEVAGSGLSVLVHVLFFAAWIIANSAEERLRFDPFPFSLLTSIVSLEAIILTLFVLANQKRQMREADKRAHLDLQVNLLSEQEMTILLRMLRELCINFNLTETIQSRAFQELIKKTDVADLADRVEQTLNSGDAPRPISG